MNFHTDRVQKECDELLYTGSVTRYGPQSVVSQRKWLKRLL